MTGGIENNVLVTKTSEQSKQYSRDPEKKIVQFLKVEEARVVVRSPHQNERDEEQRNPTLRYIYRTQNILCVCLDSTVSDSINQGAPRSEKALNTNL